MSTNALPPVVDAETWQRQLEALREREKAATRELDAIAAQRRRMPMVRMPDYTLDGEEGPVRLADVFGGRSQLIVYNHMWFPGQRWQCSGCTGFTSQFTRLQFLENYDARFVIVTQGPIDEAVAYKRRVGNAMPWYSTTHSAFGADVGAPPGGGFAVNVFLRDGDSVYRTWHTTGRGTEQLSHSFALIDLLPYGRREDWQDSPDGWPHEPAYSRWSTSEDIAARYGSGSVMLFAGIPVSDHAAAVSWYERFFGRQATFDATETESVWELAEDRWVYVEENSAHAGHATQTILVDDLDGVVSEIAERGIQPHKRETYDNGARKALYRDPDGNEIGYGSAPHSA